MDRDPSNGWHSLFESMTMSYRMGVVQDQEARKLLEFLDIPCASFGVSPVDLQKIFMDPVKCQELISKLKNKAFW